MQETETSDSAKRPKPLPYHQATLGYLKTEEADLWKWFSSTRRREERSDAVRLDLLKTTYRLEAASQTRLYNRAEEVSKRFGLTAPMTFYQAQTNSGMNAALAYLPGEIHVIMTGPVQSTLSDAELTAVIAHELAHFLFFDAWGGEFLVATELLRALGNDRSGSPVHVENARRFGLYTEVFADRAVHYITDDVATVVGTLIKLETGLAEVSAESYLRQAEEIFKKDRVQADHWTHPEPYIRARAINLWSEMGQDADQEIERMIEGPLSLERMDLLGQKKIAETTRRLLHALLAPSWFKSEAVLAHARLFFEDFSTRNGTVDEAILIEEVRQNDKSLQDYYCYVLLDFVTVDRDLGDPALAAALLLSRRLGLEIRFGEIVIKELGIGKKQYAKVERDAEGLIARTNEAHGKE